MTLDTLLSRMHSNPWPAYVYWRDRVSKGCQGNFDDLFFVTRIIFRHQVHILLDRDNGIMYRLKWKRGIEIMKEKIPGIKFILLCACCVVGALNLLIVTGTIIATMMIGIDGRESPNCRKPAKWHYVFPTAYYACEFGKWMWEE